MSYFYLTSVHISVFKSCRLHKYLLLNKLLNIMLDNDSHPLHDMSVNMLQQKLGKSISCIFWVLLKVHGEDLKKKWWFNRHKETPV